MDLYARLIRVGTTSMTVEVRAWARQEQDPLSRRQVAEAKISYVAIGEDGRSRPVPAVAYSHLGNRCWSSIGCTLQGAGADHCQSTRLICASPHPGAKFESGDCAQRGVMGAINDVFEAGPGWTLFHAYIAPGSDAAMQRCRKGNLSRLMISVVSRRRDWVALEPARERLETASRQTGRQGQFRSQIDLISDSS